MGEKRFLRMHQPLTLEGNKEKDKTNMPHPFIKKLTARVIVEQQAGAQSVTPFRGTPVGVPVASCVLQSFHYFTLAVTALAPRTTVRGSQVTTLVVAMARITHVR